MQEVLIDSQESDLHVIHRENFRLLGRKILGRKCVRPDVDLGDGRKLYIPDQSSSATMTDDYDPKKWRHTKDCTCWAKIVRYGPECKFLRKSWWKDYDVFMLFPEWGEWLHGIGDDYFILDEEILDDSAAALCNELERNPNRRQRPAALGAVVLVKRNPE